jgi:hypothetical protein
VPRFLSKTLSAARRGVPSLLWYVREVLVAWLLAVVMLGALTLVPSRHRGTDSHSFSRLRQPTAMHFVPLQEAARAAGETIEPCVFDPEPDEAVADVRPRSMSGDAENC